MENWNTDSMVDFVLAEHRALVARCEAKARVAEALGARSPRTRLAAALAALAARLDPGILRSTRGDNTAATGRTLHSV
jgi:hypothetical protein